MHNTEQVVLREAVQVLLDAGVTAEYIHTDRGSRAPAERRQGWQAAALDLQRGDVLVIPSLVALARSQAELERMLCELDARGVLVELPGQGPALASSIQTSELLGQLREDLLAELAAERDYWLAKFDRRRGRHHRSIAPEHELAVIEAFDAGGPRTEAVGALLLSTSSQ